MKNSSELEVLDLDHPTPRLRKLMRVLGWCGLLSACFGLFSLGFFLLEQGLSLPYEALRVHLSFLIGGLLCAAIGFWDHTPASQ